MAERLHKLLAQHGLGSRREIEKWILEGRVSLNNRPAQTGDRYEPGDRVAIDGKDVTARLQIEAKPRVLIYHKPQGQPVAPGAAGGEDLASRTVMESLPSVRGARWLAVNTMQAGDSGLLLVTTDGRLADALRRRAESTPSAYVARVLIPHPDFDIESIPRFVQYDDDTIEFESVESAGGEGTNRWFLVKAPHSHRRAAVRALFESRGLKVSRVVQVRFADLELPRDLPRGRHRPLSEEEIASLYALAGIPVPRQREHGRARRVPPDRRGKKVRGRSAGPRDDRRGPAAPSSGRPGGRRRPTGSRKSGR